MWDRGILKGNAKAQLGQYYWPAFAACLAGSFLCADLTGLELGSTLLSLALNAVAMMTSFAYAAYDFANMSMFLGIYGFVYILVLILFFALSVFLGGPISVGVKSFFIRAPYGDQRIGNIFSAFESGRYISTVKAMFFTNLRIALWSLLFYIPGIIKYYQYRFVPYIIAESPHLTAAQAMEISTRMTTGNKGEMFVLDLSFFGWYILAYFACGIGLFFVPPYVEATWAQLYFTLRSQYNGGQYQSAY